MNRIELIATLISIPILCVLIVIIDIINKLKNK
jgi:hypothetical protein